MKKRWLSVLALSLTAVGCCALGGCSLLGSPIKQSSQSENSAQAKETFYFEKISGKEEYCVMDIDTISSVDIVIPSTYNDLPVTTIGGYAFKNYSNIQSITIPDSVTTIGEDAFYGCSGLTSVYITDMSAWCNIAFYDNEANPLSCAKNLYLNDELVINLIIPDNVTTIGERAFYNCDSIKSVTIPDSVISIGDFAFNCCSNLWCVFITDMSAWCNISFGNSWANPLHYARCLYLNDEYVTDIIIPDGVTAIRDFAFSSYENLTSVEIPDSVTSIGEGAFEYFTNLASIDLPDSVISIGDFAFWVCRRLTSVVIPDSVTTIGDSAFGVCYNLVEVVNKSPHFTIRKGGFYDSIGYYALAVYNSGDTYTTKLSNDNGVIVYTDGNEKILVGYNGKETDLVIPNSITKINHHAFYSCDNLKSVVIGDSVTSIGDEAFGFCSSLTSVVIPDSVTTIGEYAFAVCGNLKSVVIPDSVTTIGEAAFWVCSSLTSVVIGDSVTTIGDYAFRYCDSLTTIYYKGTASDWSSMSIGDYNSILTNATRYYYSESQPTTSGKYWHYDENGEVAVW